MLIHFEQNGKQYEGEIPEEIFDSKIFPIFRDHLKPVEQKKFYTIDEAQKKLSLIPQKTKRFWQ